MCLTNTADRWTSQINFIVQLLVNAPNLKNLSYNYGSNYLEGPQTCTTIDKTSGIFNIGPRFSYVPDQFLDNLLVV